MANEFTITHGSGGDTLYVYAVHVNDLTEYTITADDDTGGAYSADMDTGAGLGAYVCKLFKQLGGSPAPTTDTLLGWITGIWDGSQFDFDTAVDAAVGSSSQGLTWSDRP